MKLKTKLKLALCHNICDDADKSTEYMIEFMKDMAEVSHKTVINYLNLPSKEIKTLRNATLELNVLFIKYLDLLT